VKQVRPGPSRGVARPSADASATSRSHAARRGDSSQVSAYQRKSQASEAVPALP